jgi:hypothetical protein
MRIIEEDEQSFKKFCPSNNREKGAVCEIDETLRLDAHDLHNTKQKATHERISKIFGRIRDEKR